MFSPVMDKTLTEDRAATPSQTDSPSAFYTQKEFAYCSGRLLTLRDIE